jgi:hypothetical protein
MLYRKMMFQRENEKHPLKVKRWLERELNGGRPKRHVLLMGVQIIPNEEEFALSTGQRSFTKDAPMMGAQTLLSWEECELGMEQRLSLNDAVLKDAQIKFGRAGGWSVREAWGKGETMHH